jgi:hypothetical protein
MLPACLTGQESVRATRTSWQNPLWILRPARLRIANLPLKVVKTLQQARCGDSEGSRGRKARATSLSKARRAEIARRSAKARWKSDDR